MMVSLFYFAFWAIMRGANFARPSALHRTYAQIWLFIIGWAMLVAVTVAEDRLRIGAGYLFVFLQSAIFLALLIALCELFALPKKATWAEKVREEREEQDFQRSRSHGDLSPSQLPPPVPNQESTPPGTRQSSNNAPAIGSGAANGGGQDDDAGTEAPSERTPLIGGNSTAEQPRTTFATTYRRSISAIVSGARRYSDTGLSHQPFEHEQSWSGRLPSWAWLIQFLLLGPFTIILVSQIALMLVDAVHQTGADGSSLLLPYLIIFLCSTVLFLPLAPFIHRITHHIPVFLLVVFVATLIYNLVAFPFSSNNRYKAYFIQRLDLDNGSNQVCYDGVDDYLRPIIASLPSASGRAVTCGSSKRLGLASCCFDGAGTPPRLTKSSPIDMDEEEEDHGSLVTVNATRTGESAARIEIVANNTKACFLEFDKPVSGLRVRGGSGWDDRFGQYPDAGVKTLRMWHRRWEGEWVVDVEWKAREEQSESLGSAEGADQVEGVLGDDELRKRGEGLAGAVVCMWSDANVEGTIPALDEALKYIPAWAAITKLSEGLVEGRKRFEV
jgi:hypothetical protein